MNKPLLPSQMHPDYPKAKRVPANPEDDRPFDTIYPVSADVLIAFFQAHPEFENEGEYVLVCPFCGDENSFTDHDGYCCSEVGHCEWELRGENE